MNSKKRPKSFSENDWNGSGTLKIYQRRGKLSQKFPVVPLVGEWVRAKIIGQTGVFGFERLHPKSGKHIERDIQNLNHGKAFTILAFKVLTVNNIGKIGMSIGMLNLKGRKKELKRSENLGSDTEEI